MAAPRPVPRPIPPVLGQPDEAEEARIDLALQLVPTPVEDEPGNVPFTVDNDGAAEWCMRHVRSIAVEQAANQAQRDAWVAEIDAWLASVNGPLQTARERFEAHLLNYQADRRAKDPDAKTLKLPSGQVPSTSSAPVVELVPADTAAEKAKHEAAAIAWLRETFPEQLLEQAVPIKVTESLLKTGVRMLVQIVEVLDVLDDEGEPIPEERFWRPSTDPAGKAWKDSRNLVVVQRYACPVVNPATGEPWPADLHPSEYAAPEFYVTDPTVKVGPVKPNPVGDDR